MKLCRETGALESVAWCKFTLAEIAKQAGQLDESARLYAEARALSPPDTPQLANATMNLGDIALLRGQHREARRHFEEALASFQARRVEWGTINALDNLGHLARAEQRLPDARQCFEQALQLARSAHRVPLAVNALVGLALVQHQHGQHERALELLTVAARHPALHQQTRTRHIDPALRQLQTQLPRELYEAAHERGERLDLDGALALALLLPTPELGEQIPSPNPANP
jgi:tetratricopeptide (TPR) repeat protein